MFTGMGEPGVSIFEDSGDISEFLMKDNVLDVEVPVKGLIIKESVVISCASDDHIEAQTDNISHFCTGMDNYPVYIKLEGTNKVIMCKCSDLLVYAARLKFKDFRVIEQPWINRGFDRVQPKSPTFITLTQGHKNVVANLIDISRIGASVFIDRSAAEDAEAFFNSEITITLKVPPNNHLLKIRAKTAHLQAISSELLRMGLRIYPEKDDKKILIQFLQDRKKEILDEIFANFKNLLTFRQTKDQYF
jgi:hypothetical protein